MLRIDAHQHFWKFDPVRDTWITDDMAIIQRDFLPLDLLPLLKKFNFDGTVVVQSDQSETENLFQLQHASMHDFIRGVVGWVDLRATNIEERLDYYRTFDKLKGFRHVLQGEPQRDLMLSPDFMHGVSKLQLYDFTYDILIFPDQLRFVPPFVSKFPDQKFVIDHIAKPPIRDHEIAAWREGVKEVAAFENVYCKISGMVTEANWHQWKEEDFTPYLDTVVEHFGMKRLMYGSDWPVCEVAGGYERMYGIVQNYFKDFSREEQEQFYGSNAISFYNLG